VPFGVFQILMRRRNCHQNLAFVNSIIMAMTMGVQILMNRRNCHQNLAFVNCHGHETSKSPLCRQKRPTKKYDFIFLHKWALE
jgi:hypothetical protein